MIYHHKVLRISILPLLQVRDGVQAPSPMDAVLFLVFSIFLSL